MTVIVHKVGPRYMLRRRHHYKQLASCLPQNLLLKSEQQFRIEQCVYMVVSCAVRTRNAERAAATGCAGNRRPALVCVTLVDGYNNFKYAIA